MSKYTEALQKLEEDRTQNQIQNPMPTPPTLGKINSKKNSGNKTKTILLSSISVVLVVAAIAIYSGTAGGENTPAKPAPEPAADKQQTGSSSDSWYFDEQPAEQTTPEEQTQNAKADELGEPAAQTPAPAEAPKTETPVAVAPAPAPASEALAENLTRYYTIQLVSYQTEDRAKQEVQSLSAKGRTAFYLSGRKVFRVCIEKAAEKKDAEQKLASFKSSPDSKPYKDAFISLVTP